MDGYARLPPEGCLLDDVAKLPPFKDGKATGEYQDFVVGFTAGQQDVWGRPVDVAFAQNGSLLVSDDGNGVIYRVSHKGQ